MLGIPIGEYDSDKVVNLGLNRYYGRIAFPFKYHFRIFSPGYMSSLEPLADANFSIEGFRNLRPPT